MRQTITEVLEITWPTLVIVLSIVIIMRVVYLLNKERSYTLYKEIFMLVFLAYILVLFQLVTTQDISGGGFNLTPFKEIFRYPLWSYNFNRQVIGNIVLFVPLGYFATSYCKIKKFGTITLMTILISGIIETVQYFIGRSFDIDDVILNVVGGILGFLIYICLNAIKARLPKFLQKDSVFNLLSIGLIVLVVLYAIKIL